MGAAAGCSEVVLLTIGTGIGGGLLLGGEVYRGWIGGGAEMGHMVVDMDGPPCQSDCPNYGCLETVCSGTTLVRLASVAVARRPDTALGHALEEGRELTGPLITELAQEGDPVARDAITLIGERLGVGLVSLVNIFNPQVVGDRRRGERGRRAAARARAARWCAERALAPGRDAVRIEAAAFGAEAGLVGAALAAREAGGVRGRGVGMSGGRLVVCPTPIGNLEDVTLRVLSALRDADVVACEDTRRTRVLLERYGVQASLISYHEHNERERAAELVERMRGGAVVALVSDAGMPLVSDPGYVLVQGCVAAGLEVEVLPGPSAALAALVASALPSDVWRFAGFLPRKRAALIEVLGSPETVVAFESPQAGGGDARGAGGGRSRAAGGGLPRADQGARGGRARDGAPSWPRATRRGRRAARSCWWSAARRRASGLDPAAVDAARRLVEAGARPRVAASVVAELTGAPANALYREVAESSRRDSPGR